MGNTWPRNSRTSWPSGAGRSSPVAPSASTPLPTGALAAEGPTIAVLACGVDRPYPAANGALLNRIADSGLLISEWPPGAAPHQHRFLVRNRLIAGLTRGTVVVEAAARSGAMATANRARTLGKEVLAVPGPVTSAMSVGCHELLRDREAGATLVATAAHVIEAV